MVTGLLLNHRQPVAYLVGRTIYQASTTYRGIGRSRLRPRLGLSGQGVCGDAHEDSLLSAANGAHGIPDVITE